MLPVRLDAALIQRQLPDLLLRPGQVLAARVVEQAGAKSVLSIAGNLIAAQLPEDLRAGDTVRLRVDETSPERILMRVVEGGEPLPQAIALPLPDGRRAHVTVEERDPGGGEGGAPAAVTIAYDSPALGRLDLRIELPAGAVSATIGAALGEPAERAGAAAGELREELGRATGRPAQVRVVPRRDPLDVYA